MPQVDYRYAILRDMLIEARKNNGLTQKELGQKMGQTQSSVSKIERGARQLNPIEFFDLCTILNIDPGHLLQQLPLQNSRRANKNRKK